MRAPDLAAVRPARRAVPSLFRTAAEKGRIPRSGRGPPRRQPAQATALRPAARIPPPSRPRRRARPGSAGIRDRHAFNTEALVRPPLKHRRVVSLTQALTGQDLQAIIEDLCAIVREWYSDSRHAPRAISAACISAIEQLCRHLIALQLSRDDSTMPRTLTIDIVSLARAAGMPPAVLVSFTYNFQSVEVIIEVLRGHGITDPFKGDEKLKRDYDALAAFRHDRIHTSTYKGLDGRAAYGTTERLAFILPQDFPDTAIDMRLFQGDVFRGMRLWEMSKRGYEKALELCIVQVAENPSSAEVHAKTGLALAGLGRHEEALAAYANAIELEPDRAVTHLGRAQALAKMGRAEEALAAYGRTIELAPSLAEAHLRLGRLLARMGRHGEALAACDRALGIDNAMHRAHLLRGDLLADMDRNDEALAAYDMSVELARYDEDVHLQRGSLLAEMGRTEEALAAYDRAIRLDGTYAEAHVRKAELLAALGSTDDALYFYNRAIDLDPHFAYALAGKGGILARMGRAAESAECHRAANRIDPGRY